jgi:erythromycin esterase
MKTWLVVLLLIPVYVLQAQNDTAAVLRSKIHFNAEDENCLRKIFEKVGSPDVIGLGEATHGSKEILLARLVITKYLIKNAGYKLLGLEVDLGDAYALNQYILGGKGNLDSLITGLHFWMYQTDEYRALFEWIRKYNEGKAPGNQVKVYGNDVQFALNASTMLLKYLRASNAVGIHLEPLAAVTNEDVVESKTNYYLKYFESLKAEMEKYSAQLIQSSSQAQYEFNLLLINKLILETKTDKDDNKWRNRSMATMVKGILDYEKERKIILWEHDGHLANGDGMGYYLKKEFNLSYYALATIIKEGYANVAGPGGNGGHRQIAPYYISPRNFTAGFLDINDDYFLNLADCKTPGMDKACKYPSTGAVPAPKGEDFMLMPLRQEFDGIIYFRKVQASTLWK